MMMLSTFVGLFAVANGTGQPPSITRRLSFQGLTIWASRVCIVVSVACTTVVLSRSVPPEPTATVWPKLYRSLPAAPVPARLPVLPVLPVLPPAAPSAEPTVQLKPGQEIYGGFIGHWVKVVATAYSPTDPIDSQYHETKGEWRWITADGKTDVHNEPYGVAVPRINKKPQWPYGTKIIVPVDAGYLPRRIDRVFVADDTGSMITTNTHKTRTPHIDLRLRTPAAAEAYGKRKIRVFIVDAEL
jgi:3D (Asp-Asp-Asp) domain-containing protein